MKNRFKIAIFLLLNASFAMAQGVSVSASMDSLILLVGEQTQMTLEVAQPADAVVNFPLIEDTVVSGLEVVERLPLDTQVQADNSLIVRQCYLLTAFDSALFYIDGLPFVYGDDTLRSDAMALKVLSVPVDTAQHAIADIKPIYDPPFDWPLFWRITLTVLAVIAVAVIAFFAFRYWQKHRKTAGDEAPAEPQDLRPADVIALERLDQIKDEKIWQQGRSKEFHTQLTDVLRDYIVRRYGVEAVESTSTEILNELQPEFKKDKETLAVLKAIFALADLVKFAKYKPIMNEDERALSQAYQFVNDTKLVLAENQPNTTAEKENSEEK